jgi:predicted MFS family arabinose efflux permease
MSVVIPVPRIETARATFALLAAGVSSTLVLVSMPVFVGAMASTFGWGDREVGWLASADMAGSAIAALCTIPIVGRMRWRLAGCIAIAVMVAGNVLSTFAMSFATLMTTRAVAGAGSGIMLAISYVGLCRSANPDRYFGLYVFIQLGLQVLTLAGFPPLLAAYGLNAIFLLLAGVAATLLMLVPLFPDRMPGSTATPGVSTRRSALSTAAVIGVIAQGMYFLAPGAVWGYLERIGQTFSLSLSQIGFALGASTFAGIAGALLVVLLGNRAPRGLSMAVGSALSIVSVLLLMDGSGLTRYFIAAALFNFAWNATFPYQMGALAVLDRTGAVAILSLLVQLGGLATGPLLASMLHPDQGYGTILLACIGCYLVSLALFHLSSRLDE